MSVPEIFVDKADEAIEDGVERSTRDFIETAPITPPRGIEGGSSSSSHDAGKDASPNSSLRRRESRSNSPTGVEHHPPISSPGLAGLGLQPLDTSYQGGGGGRLSPRQSPNHSRHGSSVSALDMLDSLDNSAWGESIRRSFTLRRPNSPTSP